MTRAYESMPRSSYYDYPLADYSVWYKFLGGREGMLHLTRSSYESRNLAILEAALGLDAAGNVVREPISFLEISGQVGVTGERVRQLVWRQTAQIRKTAYRKGCPYRGTKLNPSEPRIW